MGKGQASGEDREYQVLCQAVVRLLYDSFTNLTPYSGDGIDVEVPLTPTPVVFDVLMVAPTGELIVVEAKRWKYPVVRGELAKFSWDVERLRKCSGRKVAAITIAKSGFDPGAQKIASFKEEGVAEGVEIAILGDRQTPDKFAIRLLEYDSKRDTLLESALVHLGVKLEAKASLGIARIIEAKKPTVLTKASVEVLPPNPEA